MTILRFLHMLGVAFWIGGGLAAVAIAVIAPRGKPAGRAASLRLIGQLHSWIIAPGILIALATGFVLVGRMGTTSMPPSVAAMAGIGIVAGLLALFAELPTAIKLSAISGAAETDPPPPALKRVERRLAIVALIATVLAIVALYFGATPGI